MNYNPNDETFYNEEEIREIDFSESNFLGKDNEKRKRKNRRLIILLIIVLLLLVAVYAFGIFFYRNHFFPRTNVDGIDIGNCTDESAQIKINNTTSSREVTIVGIDDLTSTITANEIDLKFNNLDDLETIIKNQNTFLWPFELFHSTDNDFTTDYSYSRDLLNNIVNNLPLVTSPDIVAPVNAQIDYNGEEFFIQPSVKGDQPNIDKLKTAIIDALLHNDSELNLEEDNLNYKPEITESDPSIIEDVDELNKVIQASITINFPDQPTVLNKDIFNTWLSVNNGKVTINDDDLTNYVAGLADEFNTQGKSYNFKMHNGGYTTFRLNEGYILNQPQTVNTLRDQLLNGEVQTEDPIWSQANGSYLTGDEITNNYIEVSLTNQQAWLYNNGNETISSQIVSGDVSKGQQTATGLYFVKSKTTNVTMNVLLPDGTRSDQTVNFYISYGNNSGFISTPWRTNYGGTIYRNQGTSGFIAMPENILQTIYNIVDVNYPVVIY